jgi:Ni,Fe-hydrogenase III large subunit
MKTTIIKPVLSIILMFAVLSTLSNCSKDSVVNVDPGVVAGTFDFTNYEFIPNASAIQAANVLDTLVTVNTNLRLIAGGQFILSYQFINGFESVIIGDFTASDTEIRLNVSSGNDARLTSLLLHTPLIFSRSTDSGKLTLTATRTVNLAAFSNRYAGIPPVTGRLELELQQRPTNMPN